MRFIVVLFGLCLTCLAMANTGSTKVSLKKLSVQKLDIQTLALQKHYLQTIDCRGAKKLTTLLQQSLEQADDLSAKGNHAIVFEEVMMNNPSCFIQALNALPPKACDQIEENFIHETFFYPRAEIKQALSGAKNYPNSCLAS